jgi:hypothetical protein
MGLALPAPGMQDPGASWAIGPDAALICGQPLAGRGRRVARWCWSHCGVFCC